jgi:hypothetical protein
VRIAGKVLKRGRGGLGTGRRVGAEWPAVCRADRAGLIHDQWVAFARCNADNVGGDIIGGSMYLRPSLARPTFVPDPSWTGVT